MSIRRVSESYRDELSSNDNMSSPRIRSSRSSENLQPPTPPTPSSPFSSIQQRSQEPAHDHDGCLPIENNNGHPNGGGGILSEHASSTSSGSSSNDDNNNNTRHHNRGMSDPFDSERMSDAVSSPADEQRPMSTLPTCSTTTTASNDGAVVTSASTLSSNDLPTLPRYPVAATKNCTNCWSETSIAKFSVRSATYLDDKKKMPSAPYLLSPRGADLLLFDESAPSSSSSSSSYTELATPLPVEKFLNGTLLKQPTIAIIFRFPWGCMNQYFALPDMYRPFLQQHHHHQHKDEQQDKISDNNSNNDHDSLLAGFTPAQKCLAEWLSASDEVKNASLKLIALVDEGPFLVRQLVTGRPVLIGTKLALTYRHLPQHDVLLCELNIGTGSATAKRIVSVCRRYMNALTVDLGWLVQADTRDHLPETMMGAVRLHHPDALKAPKLASAAPPTATATTTNGSSNGSM